MSNVDFKDDQRPVEVPKIEIEALPDKVEGRKWLKVGAGVLVAVLLGVIVWLVSRRPAEEEYPVSVAVNENIAKLAEPYSAWAEGSVLTSDSVLGIGLDIYTLRGLRASIEYDYPDMEDSTIVIFMRSVDYRPDFSLMGTMVVDGELMADNDGETDGLRPAYIAISPQGRAVLGVDFDGEMSSHIEKIGGSFFRQQLLLSNGVKPQTFQLHGKVERAAIGRTFDDELFYVITNDKATMSDFADALKNYGFIDAIYITGGNIWNSYRDEEGVFHPGKYQIGKADKYNARKERIPLLVFRR